MQIAQIMDDFMDYRAYVSHTLCQHRLFLGLSSPGNARERLGDAYVWPLVHDEANQLCDMTGTLYGIDISKHHELVSVIDRIRKTLKEMVCKQVELVQNHDNSAFAPFSDLARSLHDQFRELYSVFETNTPDFSKAAVLEALENKLSDEWLNLTNNHIKLCLAPIVRSLLSDDRNILESELYCGFWPQSSFGYLLTRKAVVAAAMEDLPIQDLLPIRGAQKLLRGIEAVVSCWAPSVTEETRPEQIDKVIRAEGFHSRLGLLSRLEDGVKS